MNRSHVMPFAIAVVVLTPLAAAQLSMQVEAATAVTIRAGVPPFVTSTTAPAGTVGNTILGLPVVGAEAESHWAVEGDVTYRHAFWRTNVMADAAGGIAELTPSEVLLTLSAPVPTPVTLEISRELALLPGTPAPSFSIDIHDDGVAELSELMPQTIGGSFVVGPTPIVVRLKQAAAVADSGLIELALNVRVWPSNDLTLTTVANGCPGGLLLVAPSFVDRGLDLRGYSNGPQLVVIGFTTVGLTLPAPAGTCTLLPNPDIVVFLPTAQRLAVPLPPASRPVTAWLQMVTVLPGGFRTSNATLLVAQ